ncbi:MAG: ankyrin repeat protein [Chthonomonadaceae bacterium]|nr:ankyrin repeat protein [Chthonomonadaceae bacterium]
MKIKYSIIGMSVAVMLATLPMAVFATDLSLAESAKQGNTSAVHTLLKQKADVNAALADGTTALHWAAFNEDREMVDLLLRTGADPRVTTRVGAITPLSLACINGNTEIVAALLKAGADPNAATATGATPLMTAAASGSVPAVIALLDHGAEVNAREAAHGQTALMFAAAKDRSSVIRVLIARGADARITSNVTPVERAAFDEDGNPLSVRPKRGAKVARTGGTSAVTSSDAATQTAETQSPVTTSPQASIAAVNAAAGRRAAATVIGGNTALLLAARDGHLAAVQALVESGADVNQPGAGDKTPPIVMAICNGHYDVAKYLLDDGADPNQTTEDGLAALYSVIDTQWAPVGWAPNPITGQEGYTYLDLMKALLDHGAKPNTRLTKKLWFRPTHHDESWVGSAGATPFWRAAQATDLAAMRLLIAHGADPKIAATEGANALMVAAGLG